MGLIIPYCEKSRSAQCRKSHRGECSPVVPQKIRTISGLVGLATCTLQAVLCSGAWQKGSRGGCCYAIVLLELVYACYPLGVSNGWGCVPVSFTRSFLQSRSSNPSLISDYQETNPKSVTGLPEGNTGLLEYAGALSYICLKRNVSQGTWKSPVSERASEAANS